jgi:hypothetical protein
MDYVNVTFLSSWVSDRTPLARHCPSPSASSLESLALPLEFRAALWRQHHRRSGGRLPGVLAPTALVSLIYLLSILIASEASTL